MKADPMCTCEASNSCVDKTIMGQDTANILGIGTSGSPYGGVRQLIHGEASAGLLSGSGFNQMSAIAKKANDLLNKVPIFNQNLSPNDLKNASIYQQAGIPASVAAHMAGANIPKSALDLAMTKAQGLGTVPIANYDLNDGSAKSKFVDFSGGGGMKKSSGPAKREDDFMSKFGNIGKKQEPKGSNKFVEFAVQQAQQTNQISKTDSSLFEIISNRYAGSAFRLLELEK
jgi:hypothetical protein